MKRGKTHFRCTECGHVFKADDIEYCATVLSVPQPCPKCNSIRTLPLTALLHQKAYRDIWNAMEKQ